MSYKFDSPNNFLMNNRIASHRIASHRIAHRFEHVKPKQLFIMMVGCFGLIHFSQAQQPQVKLSPELKQGAYHISCAGQSNGAIQSLVIGGKAPYTYQWNDLATSVNRTALSAGTYILTVTDSNMVQAGYKGIRAEWTFETNGIEVKNNYTILLNNNYSLFIALTASEDVLFSALNQRAASLFSELQFALP